MVCPSDTLQLELDRGLERELTAALKLQGFWTLRDVQVSADCGCVTLRGAVPTFYARQVSQQTCRSLPGVQKLVDDLTVTSW